MYTVAMPNFRDSISHFYWSAAEIAEKNVEKCQIAVVMIDDQDISADMFYHWVYRLITIECCRF